MAHAAPKTFGFGFRALKKFPELIPLAVIMGAAGVGAVAFIGYALVTKPDVRINRLDPVAPWEKVGGTKRTKLLIINEDNYIENEELNKLRKEIGSYKV